MTQMLGYCSVHEEAKKLVCISFEIAAKMDIQEWETDVREKLADFLQTLESNAQAELCCIDVVPNGAIDVAERARAAYHRALLLLISEPQIAPTRYLRPTIRPTSLLLRPFSDEQAHAVLGELLRDIERMSDTEQNLRFLVDTRKGRCWIPYGEIRYFEARERKIFLCCIGKEISFYDTLENLEAKLPKAFLRCHKGFIVNRWHIDRIAFAQNLIILQDGMQIPISRSYKAIIRDIEQ